MQTRITQNLLSTTVLANLNRNLADLLNTQTHLSSGKRIEKASDDPVGTSSALRLRTQMGETTQHLRNIDQSNTQLQSADTVFDDMSSLLMRAEDLAIAQANVTADLQTRTAVAQEVTALINQFVNLVNTRVGNRYIFAGFKTLDSPFVQSENGVNYVGDSGNIGVEIEGGTVLTSNIAGSILLPTVVDDLGGHADLAPYSEKSVPLGLRKLTEMNLGTGVDDGLIQITTRSGQVAKIDLRGAKTLDEVAFRINNAVDSNRNKLFVSVRVDEDLQSLVVQDTTSVSDRIPGQNLVVEELGNGRVARQLGILGRDPDESGVITGRDLAPIKLTTNLDDLHHGSGVEKSRIQLTDRAGNSAIVDIASAQTLTDVRELINQAGTNIRAEINTGGNGILITDGSSGSSLGTIRISEYGTNTHTAEDLGILTPEAGSTGNTFLGESLDPRLTLDTPLALLNRAQGFQLENITVENGPKKGTLNFSRASTVGDIVDILNNSGFDLVAKINDLGTGISVKSLVGGRTLKIGDGTGGFAATLLGIAGSRVQLVDPVTPLGTDSDLQPALSGDTRLNELNQGKGVKLGIIRLTDSTGNSININTSGVNTVQGVLNLINQYGSDGQGLVNIKATLSTDQKGISIIDTSIPNTLMQKVTPGGDITIQIGDIKVGDTLTANLLTTGSEAGAASDLHVVDRPVNDEISISGFIDSVNKETQRLSVRAQDGSLYSVISQQPVDNLFAGQTIEANGKFTPNADFEARTVALVAGPGQNEEQIIGQVESVDTANNKVTVVLGDGSRREINLITSRSLLKVEDIGASSTAHDLGISGTSVVGSDRIVGEALNPLISEHTALNLLNGGTFVPGKINISNGEKEAVIDLGNAQTIEDALTLINTSPVGVVASINSTGTGLTIRSRIDGATLMINKIALTNPDGSNRINPDGTTIFDETADNLGLTGSQDVLGNLMFLRTALLNNNQEDIQRTLANFSDGLNRILNQRTTVGARSNQLSTTQTRGQDSNLRNTETLSGIEDLDVVQAVSQLAAQENAFNAALGAAGRIILPSLLDYL